VGFASCGSAGGNFQNDVISFVLSSDELVWDGVFDLRIHTTLGHDGLGVVCLICELPVKVSILQRSCIVNRFLLWLALASVVLEALL